MNSKFNKVFNTIMEEITDSDNTLEKSFTWNISVECNVDGQEFDFDNLPETAKDYICNALKEGSYSGIAEDYFDDEEKSFTWNITVECNVDSEEFDFDNLPDTAKDYICNALKDGSYSGIAEDYF